MAGGWLLWRGTDVAREMTAAGGGAFVASCGVGFLCVVLLFETLLGALRRSGNAHRAGGGRHRFASGPGGLRGLGAMGVVARRFSAHRAGGCFCGDERVASLIIDVCSFLPVAESYRARLLGWASIPGYFRMFSKGLSAFCGVEEAEFRRRAVDTTPGEMQAFVDEVSARLGEPVSKFVAALDEAGYDKAVVFSIDQQSTTGVSPLDPEVLAAAVDAYPQRIAAFQGVDPHKDDAAATLERGVRELGLHGTLLVPFLHGAPADSPVYRPVYRKCLELGVPVWIHTSVNWAPRTPWSSEGLWLSIASAARCPI